MSPHPRSCIHYRKLQNFFKLYFSCIQAMCMCYVYNGDCLIPAVHKFIVTGAQDHSHHHKHGMKITIIFFPSVNVSCMMVESSHARPKLIWIFPCITHGLKVTVFMSWKWWLLSYLSSLLLKGLIVLSHHCLLVYHPLLLCETVSSGVMVQPGKPVEPHSLEWTFHWNLLTKGTVRKVDIHWLEW